MKSDDSIGLLSFKEGDRSYVIEIADRDTMNHLRNMCASKRVKFISNQSQILFDLGPLHEEVLQDIQQLLDDSPDGLTLSEVSHVPEPLKQEFYRALKDAGHMTSSKSRYSKSDYKQGSRRG